MFADFFYFKSNHFVFKWKNFDLKWRFIIFDNVMSLDSVFAEIEEKYQSNNPASYRFCYTSAEIENFCKRLDFVRMGKEVGESINKDDILESIDMIIPIVISAQEGVSKMLAQRKLFKEI